LDQFPEESVFGELEPDAAVPSEDLLNSIRLPVRPNDESSASTLPRV
jgi:hypothetical protein